MSIIYKYPFRLDSKVTFALPKNAIILDIDNQSNETFLWALVEESSTLEIREFICVFAGQNFCHNYSIFHIKTLTDPHGLVWHIFEDNR
jgi:hypothetical protein